MFWAASGPITCRTTCGSYCANTCPLASCNRFTIIGRINFPPLAIVHIAIIIWSGVTAIPCPIGIREIVSLSHRATG